MKRHYVDTTVFASRSMISDGNIDYQFWHDKSIEDRLRAAASMISVAFGEPVFLSKKVDRDTYSSRKHKDLNDIENLPKD